MGHRVAGLDVVIKNAEAGDGHTDRVLKLRTHDKLKALELWAKYRGLLTDKHDVRSGGRGKTSSRSHARTTTTSRSEHPRDPSPAADPPRPDHRVGTIRCGPSRGPAKPGELLYEFYRERDHTRWRCKLRNEARAYVMRKQNDKKSVSPQSSEAIECRNSGASRT
jgi:hypothetical protein